MGEEDDVQAALAFLRKHDVSAYTAAPAQAPQLQSFDIEDLNADIGYDEPELKSSWKEPVGPNWKKPGNLRTVQLPKVANHPDHLWLMHERQEQNGKYKPWLFFSKMTGEYFRVNSAGNGFEPMSVPHNPWSAPIVVRAGNASVIVSEAAKLDMTVLLPDLQRTGFLLKQPLEFLDTPASLFVLCTAVRNSNLAAEFCAKRFHSALLPKLSSRATVWYDYELIDLLTEATKGLDQQLLESSAGMAGCSLAVALLIGCRLVVASIGSARCILCRPGTGQDTKTPGQPSLWTTQRVAGYTAAGAHTLLNKDEASRVETESGGIFRVPQDGSLSACRLYGRSASPLALSAVTDEWEREHLRVTRALSSFAILGLVPTDIKEGAASIRKSFRRRSLIVHPDKVSEERRQRTTAMFSKMEAAVEAIEGMIGTDAAATVLLAEIHCVHDEGRLEADPAVAQKLLGLSDDCSAEQARQAAKKKFQEPLGKLQNAARQDVERALKLLEIAEESAVRGSQLWMPADEDVGVQLTQGLGCKDLKSPAKLLGTKLSVEIMKVGVSEISGLALIAEGAEALNDTMVARRMTAHAPGRPRAAALRCCIDGATLAARAGNPRKNISAVCVYLRGEQAASDAHGLPQAKRAKTSGRPEQVRVSHVLLRWAGMKADQFARPGIAAPKRTQAEAEKQLLELAETLLAARDPTSLGERFKAAVLDHSECSTALNVPHADLGWLDPGGAEPPFEIAAFDTALGDLSDVVITSRGAHLMYRLG